MLKWPVFECIDLNNPADTNALVLNDPFVHAMKMTFKLNATKLNSLMNNLVHDNKDTTFFIRTEQEPYAVSPAICAADNQHKHLTKFFKKIKLYNLVRLTHDSQTYKYIFKKNDGPLYAYYVNKNENELDAMCSALAAYYSSQVNGVVIEGVTTPTHNISIRSQHNMAIEATKPVVSEEIRRSLFDLIKQDQAKQHAQLAIIEENFKQAVDENVVLNDETTWSVTGDKDKDAAAMQSLKDNLSFQNALEVCSSSGSPSPAPLNTEQE